MQQMPVPTCIREVLNFYSPLC
ncbi:hypothetical protein BN1723_019903 [Verticillium longisporum]|uniref:Uncharacterized protein n=1 Tax=Verticillium longisporum TaxID=100787 RepID=A0A0G4NI74_VERLO|nr:hypothetical protein BN1723_019903 [Verticillium longisporum]